MGEGNSNLAGSPSRWTKEVFGQRDLVEVVLVFPETILVNEGNIAFI